MKKIPPVKPESIPRPSLRPRGRPRSASAHAAILGAARALLAEVGLAGLTMEAVAARAGVGKPTIYRWWPDRHAVAMAALMAPEPGDASARPADHRARSPVEALRRQLRGMAAAFAAPTGRAIATMLASAEPETEIAKAFRNHFVLASRRDGEALLREAMTAGEIARDIDVPVALDLIYGPLFFRLMLGHAALDRRFVDTALDAVLRGLAPR